MKKIILPLFLLQGLHGYCQSILTTTVTNLKVNDSLQVVNNISTNGNVKATGEIIATDTMRAKKDVLVDGNVSVDGNLNVNGTSNLSTLRVGGPLILSPYQQASIDPCIKLLVTQSTSGGDQMLALSPSQAANLEALVEANPCPQPPLIPFTWQTYGNHVNSNNRWIGTYENYDFNIKTNNTYQLICKSNGDIGLGAFGGNSVTTNGKKYRLFVANTGEISSGIQDATGKYPFVVKPNGATSIGFGRPKVGGLAANAMLTVDGLLLAKEIRVAIANTHWADFVFDKKYTLMPLPEVEKHIIENKCLPDVPSEATVTENGVNLVDMNATLLRKIEELTLYLIDQNKRLKKIEDENELLKIQLKK